MRHERRCENFPRKKITSPLKHALIGDHNGSRNNTHRVIVIIVIIGQYSVTVLCGHLGPCYQCLSRDQILGIIGLGKL